MKVVYLTPDQVDFARENAVPISHHPPIAIEVGRRRFLDFLDSETRAAYLKDRGGSVPAFVLLMVKP